MTVHVPFQPLPADQTDVRYLHGPDSSRRSGVPTGQTTSFSWDDSRTYPGTSRTVWVHVPAGHDPAEPAELMVFQDGWWCLDPDGEVRAGVVLDNLVHHGDIPPTIGVFVDPGTTTEPQKSEWPKQRNLEYDAFDGRYASFLLDEILPQVTSRCSVSADPDRWGICGG
ncbi:MAG: alpha/beta hydrolase, partial [Janthinobacterium lividum]